MIKEPLTIHYTTKLELKMWSSLPAQYQDLLSKTKYKACVVATCFLEPLKHLAGAVESLLVRFPLSLAFSAGLFIGKTTRADRLCSENVITNLSYAQKQLGSVKHNLIRIIVELVLGLVLIPAGVVDGYRRLSIYKTEGPIRGFRRDLGVAV